MKYIRPLFLIFALGCQSTQNRTFTGPVPPPPSPIYRGVSSANLGSGSCNQRPTLKSPLIRSDYQPGEIMAICNAAIAIVDEKLKAIANLPPAQRNFTNTMLAYENANSDFGDQYYPLSFISYVSPSDIQRTEAASCAARVGEFYSEVVSRRDLYNALKSSTGANDLQKRLAKETLRGYILSGMSLTDDKVALIRELNQRLSSIRIQFQQNLTNNSDTLEFTQAELDGAPESYLQNLKRASSNKLIVPVKEPDFVMIRENVKVSESRRRMALAWDNRERETNLPLLSETLQIRHQIATTLGYATFADMALEDNMAKTAENVRRFLQDLQQKVAVKNRQEQNQLLTFKKEFEPTATSLDSWDIHYYLNQVKKRDFQVDSEKIRDYFPAHVVIQGMLDVYAEVLDLDFIKVENPLGWVPDVTLYEVRKKGSCETQAYFYMDLESRQGKGGGAFAAPLIRGRQLPGGYQVPVASIVANFRPPAEGGVTLLSHDEVNTLFHEHGHIMHEVLTKVPYGSLAGISTASDFSEAPSQMLENWVWDAQILNRLSGHYQNTSNKLPQDLLAQMIRAEKFGKGIFYSNQLVFANFDMTLHTSTRTLDTIETYKRIYREILGIPAIDGTAFPARFGHIMGGYAAGYYGYTWSEVYAADMFSKFETAPRRLLDVGIGKRYKETILEKGGSKESSELLRDFLGREPNSEAFNKSLGL